MRTHPEVQYAGTYSICESHVPLRLGVVVRKVLPASCLRIVLFIQLTSSIFFSTREDAWNAWGITDMRKFKRCNRKMELEMQDKKQSQQLIIKNRIELRQSRQEIPAPNN